MMPGIDKQTKWLDFFFSKHENLMNSIAYATPYYIIWQHKMSLHWTLKDMRIPVELVVVIVVV